MGDKNIMVTVRSLHLAEGITVCIRGEHVGDKVKNRIPDLI